MGNIQGVNSVGVSPLEEEKRNRLLSLHTLSLMTTQAQVLEDETSTAVSHAASVKGAKLTSAAPPRFSVSPAGSYWPSPSGDEGGVAGDTTVPSDPTQAYQKLVKLLLAYSGSEDDMAGGQVLMVYMIHLEQAKMFTGPAAAEFQALMQSMHLDTLLPALIQQNWEMAFFQGTDGQFVSGLYQELGPAPRGPLSQQILVTLEQQVQAGVQYAQAHTSAGGIRFYQSPYTGQTYLFDPTDPTFKAGDDLAIYSLVVGENRSWDQQFGIGEFLRTAHSGMFTLLQKTCGDNPALLIALFMASYDETYQEQIDSYAKTENRLSGYTNDYLNGILNFFNKVGSFQTFDPKTMATVYAGFKQFVQAGDIFYSQHVSNPGFFSDYDRNTFQQIMDTGVTSQGQQVTLGALYKAIQGPNDLGHIELLLEGLNSLNPPAGGSIDPSGKNPPVPPAQPSAQLQTLINALSSGSSLVTQQSKSVGTLATEMTNTDSQLIKVMASTVDPTGSGLVAMVQNMVQHQITN